MKDSDKTKTQLIEELRELRGRVVRLEAVATDHTGPDAEAIIRSMAEHLPIELWARDRQGRCILQSEVSIQARGDFRGRQITTDDVSEDTLRQWDSNNRRVMETGEVLCKETRQTIRNGQPIDLIDVVGPIYRDGNIEGVVGIVIDVTEKKRAAEALRESEDTARAILNSVTESMILFDREYKIITLNDEAAARLGGTVEELTGRNISEFVPPEICATRSVLTEEAVRTRRSVSSDDQRNGRDYHACIYPVFDEKGEVSRFAVYAQDVTERKAAERAIRQEQQRLLRLVDLYENDRKLAAYEIHEALSQPLTAALMQIEAAVRTQYPTDVPEGCRQGLELLRESIRETRRLIGGTRPLILDEEGLLVAVDHLVSGLSESEGPEISWTHDVRFDRLALPLETAVYRIIHESLDNACRHSQGEKVEMKLTEKDSHLHIEVQDWGVGFRVDQVAPDSRGLDGIRERSRLFGGRAEIDSSPGEGTRIVVGLPIVEDGQEEDRETALA